MVAFHYAHLDAAQSMQHFDLILQEDQRQLRRIESTHVTSASSMANGANRESATNGDASPNSVGVPLMRDGQSAGHTESHDGEQTPVSHGFSGGANGISHHDTAASTAEAAASAIQQSPTAKADAATGVFQSHALSYVTTDSCLACSGFRVCSFLLSGAGYLSVCFGSEHAYRQWSSTVASGLAVDYADENACKQQPSSQSIHHKPKHATTLLTSLKQSSVQSS